jgi:hypothetical protein
VSLFKELSPLEFGQFNRAFITMFRIASGDPWPVSPGIMIAGNTNSEIN